MSEFESLPGFVMTETIAKSFVEDAITTPTQAQLGAFGPILEGKHVVIDSGTGTGKTLAYLLPLLQRLRDDEKARVVCLAPSAELAVQTSRVVSRYKDDGLSVAALVGGGSQNKQKERLQKGTRLVVGTPGRVLEMIELRKLKGVTTFVLDEPEPILANKDADFLVEVLSRPPRPQIIVAGATFGQNSQSLVARMMSEKLERIKTGDSPLLTHIHHQQIRVRDAGDRDLQLARFLERESTSRAIVYVNQAHLIRHVYRNLTESGILTVTVSQDRSKAQCKQAMGSFAQGEVQVLLTTDRAATGIDIEGVPLVLHYELPRSTQAYVHRAGRTGRAGKKGRSIIFSSDQERVVLKRFEKELGVVFEPLRV